MAKQARQKLKAKTSIKLSMTKQDIDLQKIDVLESSYQGWFNFKASLVAGVVIGTLILLATAQYEQIFPTYATGIGNFIVLAFALYSINGMKKDHERHLSFISGLIQQIEKGERLDSIEGLKEKHKEENKKPKSKASDAKI
jgi:hypothetical protein